MTNCCHELHERVARIEAQTFALRSLCEAMLLTTNAEAIRKAWATVQSEYQPAMLDARLRSPDPQGFASLDQAFAEISALLQRRAAPPPHA